MPFAHDGRGSFHELIDQLRVIAAAYLAFHEFLKDGLKAVAMRFGQIAEKVVAPSAARSAAPGVGLFQHDHARALFRRRYGRHKAADAASDDGEIRFQRFTDGQHISLLSCRSGLRHPWS